MTTPRRISPIEKQLIVDSVLLRNGQETIRQAAARADVSTTTLWETMQRAGFKGRSVTLWERVDDG